MSSSEKATPSGAVLTARRQRFVEEYLVDLNATQAAIRAGYSEHTAYAQGSRLLDDPDVRAAIEVSTAARAERTQLDQDWVVRRLQGIVERATHPATFNGAVANGALSLLGKHLGMFVDRAEVHQSGGNEIRVVFRRE